MLYHKKLLGQFYRMMNERLGTEGWDTPTHFAEKSGVPYKAETVRRVFKDCGDSKRPGADTLAVILRHLNYSRDEIRDILKTYTDDDEVWRLLPSDGANVLTADEEAALNVYKMIRESQPGLIPQLFEQVKLLAKLSGVDVSASADLLIRKGGRRKGDSA